MGIAYGIAGLGGLIGSSIKEATEYDNLMQTAKNILNTHDKLPNFEGRFAAMAQTVRDVGVETKFTSGQVADAARYLAMAGFNLEGINHAIRPVADIALIGDTDLGTTADVLTNISTGYRIAPENLRWAADVMTMTFTKTNTTLMEIAESYKYASSILSAAGIDFEESTAAIGILGDAGIKGSQAGTSMRTIVANIVKPTKQQLNNWKRTGVERFDKEGNIRPLVDIFADLGAANLKVEDFYKMFHRTAAQGAVSLTHHVDKWNELILKNFLSAGLSKRLADEKKQTIEGLWYQLTSSFTEGFLKVFEKMKDPIKEMLRSTTDWLQSGEGIKMISDLFKEIFKFIPMLKNFAIGMFEIYNQFKGLINLWIKLQIHLMPVLMVGRAVRAIFFAFVSFFKMGGSVLAFAANIRVLLNSFVALKTVVMSLGAIGGLGKLSSMAILGGALFRGNEGFSGMALRQAANEQANKLMYLQTLSPETQKRYHNINRIRRNGIYNRFAWGGAGAIVGGMLGSTLGNATDSEYWSPVLSTAGSIGGAALGGIGLKAVAGSAWFAKLAPLASNPAGWVALAVAAIGSIGYAFFKNAQKVRACTEETEKYIESTKAINGINMSDGASNIDKWYSVMYNSQLGLNASISEHIRLLNERDGILQGYQGKKEEGGEPFKKTNKDFFEKFRGQYSWLDWIVNRIPKSREIAESMTKTMGGDMTEGSNAYKTTQDWLNKYLQSTTLGDFTKVDSELDYFLKNYTIGKSGPQPKLSEAGNMSKAQLENTWAYAYEFQKTIGKNFSDEESIYRQRIGAFKEIVDLFEKNKPISDDILKEYALYSGVALFNEDKYGKFGSPEFFQKIKESGQTVEDINRLFEANFQYLVNGVNDVNDAIKPYFMNLVNSDVWSYFKGGGKKGENPDIIKNGEVYSWQFNGAKGIYEYMKSPDQSLLGTGDLTGGSGTGRNGGTGGTGGKENQSGYKSHYSSDSAAPKQVIVKIENLMNVKSIDLSNPNNVAVIENLKSQLSQALVDVVHDFDATFHG